MKLHDFLISKKEEMPKWLEDYKPGDTINFSDLLNSSRVVYYPGSRFDGQPIKTFNQAHFSHVYIYADYMIRKEEAEKEFLIRGFRGYKCLSLHEFKEKDLFNHSWRPHIKTSIEDKIDIPQLISEFPPFGLLCILEREEGYGEEHGAQRFVVINLCADGIATYDALFGNKNAMIHTLVLQDHGFGGNYDRFGKDGLMHEIAKVTKIYPEYILCADNTEVWGGYKKIDSVMPVQGGEYFLDRFLYKISK